MKHLQAMLLLGALTTLACVHKYDVPPVAHPTAPIPAGSLALVATPPDGRDDRNVSYAGSGASVASALATGLAGRRVSASVVTADPTADAALAAARSAGASFLVVPAIRSWSDRLTEWSGIPDRITIAVRIVDVATGQTVDERDVKASSRWLTFGGDHPQDLLPELADQWAASVVH